MRKIICITCARKKTYYVCEQVACEYCDARNNVVRTEGEMPDGVVLDYTVSKLCEKNYLNKRLAGESRIVDAQTGQLLILENYANGALNGLRVEYFPSGKPHVEENYSEGALDGWMREYNSCGKLFIEEFYRKGVLAERKVLDPACSEYSSCDSSCASAQNQPAAAQPVVPVQTPQPVPAASPQIVPQPVAEPAPQPKPVAAPVSAASPFKPVVRPGPGDVIRRITEDHRIYYLNDVEICRETINRNGVVTDIAGKIPDGLVREFHRNGRVRIEEPYLGGKICGVRKKYDDMGRIWAEETYIDNRLEGVVKIHNYFKDKIFEEEAHFKDNKLHGVRKTFYPNNVLSVEELYVDGKLDGERKSYYENGQVNTQEFYKTDRLNGTRKRYYETGVLWSEENYLEGRLDGLRREYYADGKLRLEETHKNGRLEGERRFFFENGRIMYKEFYSLGSLKERKDYKNAPSQES